MVTAKQKAEIEAAEKKKRERNGYIRIIGSYVLIAAILIGIVFVRSNDVQQAKELACTASLDNRELLAYTVAASQGNPDLMPDPSTLPPELAKLIEQSREQNRNFIALFEDAIQEPIEVCEEVGIDSRRELPVITPPTTTTTTPE